MNGDVKRMRLFPALFLIRGMISGNLWFTMNPVDLEGVVRSVLSQKREGLEYEKALREAMKPVALRAQAKRVKARQAKPTKRR